MWEAIGQAIKTFVEKHLIPTVISVVIAISSFLILPTDFWMIERIGKVPFALLVAGIAFLIIQLLIFFFRKIRGWISNKSDEEYRFQNDVKLEKEVLEKLWSSVDAFNQDDRKVLHEFLESQNAPIERSSGIHYCGNSLFNSDWLVSTEEYRETEPVSFNPPKKKGVVTLNVFDTYSTRTVVKKYKLREDIYNVLRYSMDKYGKISHFE